jgi:flagellar protein FlbT
MALKVELKPGERIIIGESVITNDNQRTRLFIEGSAPILREKDILTLKTADSPAKRIYLAVQLMYLSREVNKFQDEYFNLVKDIMEAAPSAIPFVTRISNNILSNSLYKALKEARSLIEHEQKLIQHVQSGLERIPAHPTDDSGSS